MTSNYINHIALVLDASTSMRGHADNLVRVADTQIAHLAKRSKELDQETRVSIYTFAGRGTTKCLVYDKDVLRLPSIKGLYKVGGNTALIDATLKSFDDLKLTPELYGDHAFLVYVLTDGENNDSAASSRTLEQRFQQLPENWTVAVFVPNQRGVFEAKSFGFPAGNIEVWDTTSEKGVEEVGQRINRVTDSYMTMRSTGIRGSRNLFNLDATKLDTSRMQSLDQHLPGQFRMLPVTAEDQIAPFVERHVQRPYRLGEAFYQLTKPVDVQPQKKLALFEKGKFRVHTGDGVRKMLGLPDYTVKVNPVAHPKFDIFIQSTSVNRKLVPGTNVLLLS